MKKSLRSAAIIVAIIAGIGVSAPTAVAGEPDAVTANEYATLTRIFGHEPSKAEQEAYLNHYGRVPTNAEIAAYLRVAGAESRSLITESELAGVAAKAGYGDYFKSGSWIKRSGIWSLSLMPRDGGIGNEGASRTWSSVFNVFNTSQYWVPYKPQGANESMRKQYDCHFWYGMIKTPWNLEPSKKPADINAITCN